MIPIPLIGSIISGVTGFFSKKQDIKAASKSAKAKMDMAKVNGDQTIKMTDAEWESLSVQTQQGSWKDEFVTLIITSPFVLILLGSVLEALGFDSGTHIVDGTLKGLIAMKDLGMDYGFLLSSVVLAAIGLKVWRA